MPSQHESPFNNGESLSSVMDGDGHELELRRLLAECAGNPALRQRWTRYQLVSAVIQKQHAVLSDSLVFADAVQRAIDAEEKHVVNEEGKHLLLHDGGKVVARVAIAASVALLVIVGAQWQDRTSLDSAQRVANAAPFVQQNHHSTALPVQKMLVGVSGALGVENIFAQSGDGQNMRFGKQNGFENASLKTENARVPLINKTEQDFSRK